MRTVIDIVLLPSPTISDVCFELNEDIFSHGGDKIMFEKNICIPHISILMGVCETKKIWLIIEKLQQIAHHTKAFKLTIDSLLQTKTSRWDNNYDLNIKKTEEIKNFHHIIFTKLLSYFSFDASLNHLYQDPLPEKITLKRINNYKKKQDFEKFRPHITLGVWWHAKPKFDGQKVCKISQIGIYQLWNYCTCRKEYATIELGC